MEEYDKLGVEKALQEVDGDYGNHPSKKQEITYQSDIEKEKVRQLKQANDKREELTDILTFISVFWLGFTVVLFVGFCLGWVDISDTVIISFTTSSLATVVGLWAISLRYFFRT